MANPDQFLRKREVGTAEDAVFTWLSPPSPGEQRNKFLLVKEGGDDISILPGSEARFKKGLRAWRFEQEEGGEHEVYMVLKTRHNRIDLRRVPQ